MLGDDNFGTLGDGPSSTAYTDAPSSTPIDLGTGRTAVAVSAGGDHTCAILDNGDLKCWGRDNEGQLGDGGTTHTSTTWTTEPSSTPDLGTGRTAVAVSASLTTPAPSLTTARRSVGENMIGDGWALDSFNRRPSTLSWFAISAGFEHTCAFSTTELLGE